jgi:hypothetical protein
MTAVERKEMLRRELEEARADALEVSAVFDRMIEQHTVRPAALARVASALSLKAGRIAGFAALLSREGKA